MVNNFLPFPDERQIQQFIVQFACRIPIRKEFDVAEKKVLVNKLRDLDRKIFQLFDEPSTKKPGCLLQVDHQIPVGASTITLPSFILSSDSFSFFTPVKILGTFVIKGTSSFDTSYMNKNMSKWIFEVQNAVNNLSCQRTGKIYEMVLGPFHNEQKRNIFKNLFSISLDTIGELNLTFAHYIKDEDLFNIQTNISYIQPDLNLQFFIRMRVDINNRNLSTGMEPRDIEKVWEFADSQIFNHFSSILTNL